MEHLKTLENALGVVFNGALPVWLSPVQVAILPISDKLNDYAQKIAADLETQNIRTEIYDRNDTIGKKIREAETQKIPYIAVIGEKEEKNNTLSLRQRAKGDLGEIKISDLMARLKKEIESKTL